MAGIKDYSLTAGSNTSINGIDIGEGCDPGNINNAMRQQMVDVRSLYESGGWIEWGHTCTYASGTSFTVSGDVTAVYVANRRLRAVGSGTGTIYGKVASSSYSAPNTAVNVTWDSGSLSNESLTVSVGFITATGSPVAVGSFLSASDIGVTVQAYDADTAKLDVDQAWTGAQRGTPTTDNDLSFDLNASNNFVCTPSAGGTLTFTNHTSGQSGIILLTNGSNYAITAAATTKIHATDLATISTTGVYLLSYFDNGTNAYVVVSRSFS